MLEFLPNAVFYSMTAIGALGFIFSFVLTFIPFIGKYKTVLQILSVIILSTGIYFQGKISNESEWNSKILELENKLALAEAQSASENVKIVERVVTKQKIIRERASDVAQYIDREIVKYDETCEIPAVFVDAHNKSAIRP